MKKIFTSLLCGLMATGAIAQWSPTSMQGEKMKTNSKVKNYYALDLAQIRSTLANADETGKNAKPVEILLPTLDGKIQRFAVYSAPVVVKSLADRYDLGSYVGVGIDDPSAYVRFSVAPNDFQSMMLRKGKYEFIEPQNTAKTVYGVHPKTNKSEADKAFVCSTSEDQSTKDQIDKMYSSGQNFANNPFDFSRSSDRKFRTMRLALSVNGEYTQYFGGVAEAITAVNATITRCNGIFEKDFALRLILQDFPQLIYDDPATDPYSTKLSEWNVQLQQTLTQNIGNDAYDIGHMFGASGGGGNAGCIGCVCINPTGLSSKAKGSGITSPADGIPMGDNFDIDYVAHEIGHQLGANHTFSHQLEGTGQNVEPGSGSTIMGYAGITGATNVQQHSDPYFHINSIIQVQNNLNSKTCDIETAMTNTPPVITAMADVTIPKGTAFVLTAQATDAENDPITYTWEEVDNAATAITKSNLGMTETGASFRSVTGTSNPTRYFPALETVLNGKVRNPDGWESVSMVARESNFAVTVRDNNPNVTQNQTQSAVQKVNVSDNGPFTISSEQVYQNAPGPITWNVAGTDGSPFNVANVSIDYTADNGQTWQVLAASTPNDGSENFLLDTLPLGSKVKVRVSAIGNVFYAIREATVSTIAVCDGSAPAALTVSDITLDAATITWTAISNASYILRYKLSNSSTWTEVPLTTNSYLLTDLEDSSSYDIQVAAVCSGTVGAYTEITTFQTVKYKYCAMTSDNATDEYISKVEVVGEGTDTMTSTSRASKYSDFSDDPARLVRLKRGTSGNTISVTKAWKESATGKEGVGVWIDFNRNGAYEADEQVMATQPDKTTPVTATFSVPADAYTGSKPVGMRVVLRYNKTPNYSCGTIPYGEVEDYSVEITEVLAVNDNAKSQGVQVYPNPATDFLNITKVSDKATYTIYNMAGQAVSKGKVTDNKVAVSKLQQGVYIIAVDYDGEVSKLKFIKK